MTLTYLKLRNSSDAAYINLLYKVKFILEFVVYFLDKYRIIIKSSTTCINRTLPFPNTSMQTVVVLNTQIHTLINRIVLIGDERATLARATRVVIHSYLYSGLRPSVRWKITSDNGNLRNFRYTKNTCHVMLALITWRISVTDYSSIILKPRFWHNSEVCLLFSRKQQQIFIIYSWQYHIRNQRTRLPQ